MIDTKLRLSKLPTDEAEWIRNSAIERYVEEISELIDWRIYLGLGENFRGVVAKLFRRLLEQQLEKSSEDPTLCAEDTERSAKALAFVFTHRLVLNINEAIENHFRAEYATMTENIMAEYLPVAMSRFLNEFGLKKSAPLATES
jgi:hypothetical protein